MGGAGQDFWEDLRFERRESIYVLWNCNTAIGKTGQRKRGLDMRDDWVGISRSTDFVIVVPGPFWRKVFLQKWASCKKGPTTEGNTLEEKNQTQTHQIRNKAQLNCVSLRSSLDYEVAWTAGKGQDERPKHGALDSSRRHSEGHRDVGEKNKEGRHVGLDFYDLLIEALKMISRLTASHTSRLAASL